MNNFKFKFLLSIFLIFIAAMFFTVYLLLGTFGNDWTEFNYLVLSIIFYTFAFWAYPKK